MAATRDKYSRDTYNDKGSVVFNQLVSNGDFSNGTTGWYSANISTYSISSSGGVLTITANSSTDTRIYGNVLGTTQNHKYYVSCFIKFDSALPSQSVWVGSGGYSGYAQNVTTLGVWVRVAGIFTRGTGGDDTICIYPRLTTQGAKAYVKDVFCTDLTQMFGSGNEPTSAAETQKYLPLDYYPTNSGTTVNLTLFLQPLALSEYVSDGDFEAAFFCHNVWRKKDSEGKNVVIGMLDTRSGISNSYYCDLHSNARKGRIEIVRNGISYRVLNDGGLNTKAFADTPTIDFCAVNLVIFHFAYRNAYWENTSNATATIEMWHNGSKTNERTKSLVDMPKVRGTNSEADGACYILDQDTMNSLSPSVGDTIKIKITTTNGEGEYSTGGYGSAVATARVEIIDVWKVNAVSDNPSTGTHYHCLIKPEYWVAGTGGQKTLYDLLNSYAQNTYVDTNVHLMGYSGNAAPNDLLDSPLPAGKYYGFPKTTPFVDNDPPRADKIIEVENSASGNGHAIKWYNSTYTPPTPVVPLTFTNFTIAFTTSGTYTSYATRDNDDYYVHIWPYITVTSSNAGQGSFRVELVLVEEGNEHTDTVVWSKEISVQFTAAGTKTIQQVATSETEGQQGVPITQVGCVDTSFTSQGGMYNYYYRLQITEIDADSTTSGVTLPVQTLEMNVDDLLEN